jgi:hypothetical protein
MFTALENLPGVSNEASICADYSRCEHGAFLDAPRQGGADQDFQSIDELRLYACVFGFPPADGRNVCAG